MAPPRPTDLDKPTGPTGILSSARKGQTAGGKVQPAKGPALSCSPGTKMGAMGKRGALSRGRY